jgi:5-methylcytosine-specific restriction protein A
MPGILCVAPGCKTIVRDGTSRCEKHTKTAKKQKAEIREFNGGRANSKIYNSARWRRLSNKKRTVTPFCEDCEDQGITTLANVVDHIVELNDNPKLAYAWSNLRSLCHACHNKKTAEEKRKRLTTL